MFVPGNRPRFLEKVVELPIDVVIFDLEDGVAPDARPAAREAIAQRLRADDLNGEHFVRVNRVTLPEFHLDAERVLSGALEGIVLPKVESVDEIAEADEILSTWERDAGLMLGSIEVLVTIESALGLVRAPELAAAHPRVSGLMLGMEDLALDLGLPSRREAEASELLYARSAVVVAARSAGVAAIDGVFPDLDDHEGLERDGTLARRLGFDGKALLHPSQIACVNRCFSPTTEELAHAQEIVEAFDEALRRGDGAAAVHGRFVDLPVVLRARRTIDAAASSTSDS